jgi:hypothetical protein
VACDPSDRLSRRAVVISDATWAAYIRTEVTFSPNGRTAFTVCPAPLGTTGHWPPGFSPPVHILTAWDPGEERPDVDVNRARQAEMDAELRALGLDLCPGVGRAPGSPHFEDGVAVSGLSTDHALGLAARYGQAAIFQWTPDALVTLSCVGARRHEGGWSISDGH